MTADRPTLDTVAAAAGVSRMTVSNAYNRPDQLSGQTRARVLEAADRLGYAGPDPAGRSLRRRQVGTVGVLLTDSLAAAFTDPGLVSFMRGLAAGLGAAGQSMLLVPAEADLEGALVRNAIVDAFVICSMGGHDPAVAAVKARRLPLVTAGHPRIPGIPFVGIDNRRAGALAAEHLLGLGHRRFGVVALPGRDPARPGDVSVPARLGIKERVEGFLAALGAAGVGRPAVRLAGAATNTTEAGAGAAEGMLRLAEPERPTAVFGVTDVLALGVLVAAASLGLRVPQDVSVVGFDDIAEAARSEPGLTTVAQSLYDQGLSAARLALELIAGRPARSPRLTAELVVRQSTAPPPPP